MVEIDENGITIIEKGKRKICETSIPCFNHPDCCGCLNGYWDEIEKIWRFRCNECNQESGRGLEKWVSW